MGLSEILDITETQQPNAQGELETVFRVSFLTDETSGAKTIEIPGDEFTAELARERAAERADELDAAFQGNGGEA